MSTYVTIGECRDGTAWSLARPTVLGCIPTPTPPVRGPPISGGPTQEVRHAVTTRFTALTGCPGRARPGSRRVSLTSPEKVPSRRSGARPPVGRCRRGCRPPRARSAQPRSCRVPGARRARVEFAASSAESSCWSRTAYSGSMVRASPSIPPAPRASCSPERPNGARPSPIRVLVGGVGRGLVRPVPVEGTAHPRRWDAVVHACVAAGPTGCARVPPAGPGRPRPGRRGTRCRRTRDPGCPGS